MNVTKDNMEKVSIIIPVYNGEKYVGRCIESILGQTYENIEVVCINDGSTDGSGHILKKFQMKYPDKVFVYNQNNRGIGETRNRGVQEATGTYLMFADNDDILEMDYVEQMVHAITNSRADMAVAGYRKIREDGTILEQETMQAPTEWTKFRMMAPWTKIIRKDVVVRNNIRFGENPLGEDSVFSVTAINCCDKIVYVSCAGYNWIEHATSVSNTIQKSDTIEATTVMERLIKSNTPLRNLKQKELDYFVYKFLVWHLLYTRKTLTKEAWMRLNENYFLWLSQHNSLYQNKQIKMNEPKGEKLAIRGLLYLVKTPLRDIVLSMIYRM